MKPNFLFIGPDKTGSSWLDSVLRQHDRCYVPTIKDIYFFDRYYSKGMDWYLSFFKDTPEGTLAAGEFSHDYLFSPVAAERIAEDLPGVKLLTCLRDPADRAFSAYLFLIRSGITRLPFEKALEKFPTLIDNSMYFKHLSFYFKLFRKEDIKVLFFEDLKADPRAFGADVFDFLGLPARENIDFGKKVLPASKPRSFIMAKVAKGGANLARTLGVPGLVGAVKRNPLLSRTLYRPYEKGEKPGMSPETHEMLRKTFWQDMTSLERLLGASLSTWPTYEKGAGAVPGEDRRQPGRGRS